MSKKKESFSGAVEEVVSFYTPGLTEEAETVEEASQEQPEKEQASVQEQKPNDKTRKKLDYNANETKSRRLQILIKPSIYEKLEELRDVLKPQYSEREAKHITINDLINKILEAYLKEL